MKLQHDISIVHTTHPFVIARGGATEHRLIRVRITDGDGVEGWGEAAPNRFYGETADTALGALARLAPIVEACDSWALEDVEAEMNRALRFNGSVKSAISAALHDLAGKRLGVPVYKLWGLDPAKAPLSSFTIAIAASESELRERVAQAASYPVLKVKLGTDHDADIVRTVRSAAPDKVLRVDANAAWSPKHALEMVDVLVECGVEYVEQPVAAHDIDGLRFVRERSALARDRGRIVRRLDGHSAPRRRGRRHQSQALEVRRVARGAAHHRDRAFARDARHGRLHDRDEPWHHRRGAFRAAPGLRRFRWRRAVVRRSFCRRDDPRWPDRDS